MATGLQLLTPPASPPVTLDEAALHCRVDDIDYEAALLAGLVAAAAEYAEAATGRQLVAATWLATFDRFPRGGIGGLDGTFGVLDWTAGPQERLPPSDLALRGGLDRWSLELPKSPLLSVTSVQYVDGSGALQTLDPSQYLVDTATKPGRVTPAFGLAWPVARRQMDAVRVTFVAGHPVTNLLSAPGAAGVQAVTPASMAGILAGSVLAVGSGATRQRVAVSSVTATTFTANFPRAAFPGDAVSGLPDALRAGLLLLVGGWYVHREAVDLSNLGPLPLGAEALLGVASTGAYP